MDYPSLAVVHVGSLSLRMWGVFVALGVLAATFVSAKRGQRRGVPAEQVWHLSFWVTLAGLIGGRALYVAEYWRDFTAEPLAVFAIWEGGMSAVGSILLGVLAGWIVARRRRIRLWPLANAVAPALLLGDALGRLGGAASHMYAGVPTRFPLSYVLDGVQRHEVGIELSLASVAGFLLILGAERFLRRRQDPLLSSPSLALLWYSAERFFLDFLRASDLPQSDLRYAGLTLAQYFALAGFAAGGCLLAWSWRGARVRHGRA
ncbi:MAG: phosphatidylglycerol:prolipoprotein diacylglycerol transferase [Parcubacteria group bacterium Gr01-1014_38]|nr:MAG: phosphatidylglycerol:prolipoprotein diacylglycerol transferase [Parcubacteria group bacterium Gr01-1014_38]